MAERRPTGGTKEFSYTKEDLQKIRTTDTEASKRFKDAYREYRAQHDAKKFEEEVRMHRRRLIAMLVMLCIALAVLLGLRMFG